MPKNRWTQESNRVAADARRRAKQVHQPTKRAKTKSAQRLQSLDTVLWFGKHKGDKIRDVPFDYLKWLAEQPSKGNWRMDALQSFLRERVAQRIASHKR